MSSKRPAKLNVAKSDRAKQAQRQVDERALASGAKSRKQLSRENGHFARLNVEVDFAGAKSLS
ncbi:MAG: hypothetical protein ACYC8T_34220 [Myxococcaceae bacterium]